MLQDRFQDRIRPGLKMPTVTLYAHRQGLLLLLSLTAVQVVPSRQQVATTSSSDPGTLQATTITGIEVMFTFKTDYYQLAFYPSVMDAFQDDVLLDISKAVGVDKSSVSMLSIKPQPGTVLVDAIISVPSSLFTPDKAQASVDTALSNPTRVFSALDYKAKYNVQGVAYGKVDAGTFGSGASSNTGGNYLNIGGLNITNATASSSKPKPSPQPQQPQQQAPVGSSSDTAEDDGNGSNKALIIGVAVGGGCLGLVVAGVVVFMVVRARMHDTVVHAPDKTQWIP